MNCNEIKDMMSLYIDGELEDKEKILVEEHIGKCQHCQKELEDYKKIINMLQNMTEEEPPEGYCSRLHEKLLKTKVQKKISARSRWMKYGGIAAAFVLIVSVIYVSSNIGMGGMSKSENRTTNDSSMGVAESPAAQPTAPDMYGESGDYDVLQREEDGAVEKEESSTFELQENNIDRDIKIIKSGTIIAQTESYDVFLDSLITNVESIGGYIEQNNTSVYRVYDNKELKYGNLKIRVPQDKFYDFVNFLEVSSNINQKNIAETNVTKEYYEKDNRVKNLELQEVHLRELFEKAQTVEEMLLIENELRRIRTEIDALSISLSDIDDRASMSTISLELEEVLKANLTMSQRDSVWERAKEGFINTVNGIVQFGENVIIKAVSVSPVLIPLIIILVLVFINIRKKQKKL